MPDTIEAPPQTKTYACTKYPQLKLVMEPAYNELPVAGSGKSGKSLHHPGRYIQFGPPSGNAPHMYETSDPEEIEFLDNHDWNAANQEFPGADFQEVTHSIPKPDSTESLRQIAAKAALQDVEGIIEIREAELKGHMREDVLASSEAALAGIEAVQKASVEGDTAKKKPGKVQDED